MKEISPEKIKEIRKRLGSNYTRFGKEIGVSYSAVRKWEAGINRPGAKALNKIVLIARYIEYIDLLREQGTWDGRIMYIFRQTWCSGLCSSVAGAFVDAVKAVLTMIGEEIFPALKGKKAYDRITLQLDRELIRRALKQIGSVETK